MDQDDQPLRISERLRRLVMFMGVPPRDIDDVLQEVGFRLWEKRAQVNASANPTAYVAQVARNEARAYLRRAHVRREVLTAFDEQEPEHEVGDARPGPEDLAADRQRAELVWSFIDQLDPRFQPVFVAHELAGASIADIASTHAIKERTAEKRLELAWRDLDRARTRWQAAQRGRGYDSAPFFVGFLHGPGARRLLHASLRFGARCAGSIATVFLAGALLHPRAGAHAPADGAPAFQPASRLASATRPTLDEVPPVGAWAPAASSGSGSGTGSRSRAVGGAPATVVRASFRPTGGVNAETEEDLIEGAEAALRLKTADSRIRARELLQAHLDRFPYGRLTRSREGLFKRLR